VLKRAEAYSIGFDSHTNQPKTGKMGKMGKMGKGAQNTSIQRAQPLHSRSVATAQELNLANVGGSEADPAPVSQDQVLTWVGMGFDVVSNVVGVVSAIEGGELQGSEGTAPPSNAGTMIVSDPASGQTAVVTVRALWLPIAIGGAVLVGLVFLAASR
jgi:hypothetical protein